MSSADPVDLEAIARARGSTIPALGKRLSGDLDTILLKALQKEPERRYESVYAFADDLRRHLAGLPVRARKDGLAYRASRFFARHRIAVTAAAVIALLGGMLVLQSLFFAESKSVQAEQLATEERQKGELLAQLTELYHLADPTMTQGDHVASRKLLDAAVMQLDGMSDDDPQARATLLFEAGRVYQKLGILNEARPLLTEALELRRDAYDAPDEAVAETLVALGSCLIQSGGVDPGVTLLREGLDMCRALHGDDHLHVAQIRFQLGSAVHNGGQGDARKEFEEAVRIYRAHPTVRSSDYADTLVALGDLTAVRNDVAGALALYEEALELYTELYGEVHPSVATALNGIGMLRYNLDEKAEGIELLRRSIAIAREVFGLAGHPQLAQYLQNLGNVLAYEGDPEGLSLLEQALEVYRGLEGANPNSFGFCATVLGRWRRETGDIEGAIAAYGEALDVFEAGDVRPMFRTQAQQALARLLSESGDLERATVFFEQALLGLSSFLPEEHQRVLEAREELEAVKRRDW